MQVVCLREGLQGERAVHAYSDDSGSRALEGPEAIPKGAHFLVTDSGESEGEERKDCRPLLREFAEGPDLPIGVWEGELWRLLAQPHYHGRENIQVPI